MTHYSKLVTGTKFLTAFFNQQAR